MIALLFVISVALAAGSIFIASRLRNTRKLELFSTLMYLQAFYYTYGFYAFWGQAVFITFLSTYIPADILTKTTNVLTLLGSPFVLFTWLMLVKLTGELSGQKIRNSFVFYYLSGNILLIACMAYLINRFTAFDTFTTIKFIYILLNFVYSVSGAAYLLYNNRRKPYLRRTDRRNLALGLVLIMLTQNTVLVFYQGNLFVALLFIFVFFTGGAFMPLYMRYGADLSVFLQETGSRMTLDSLCSSCDISPREKEIIREICNGLSNQQIADKLFISLQTVKDHTHRIYSKTNCNSRTQLMTIIRASETA